MFVPILNKLKQILTFYFCCFLVKILIHMFFFFSSWWRKRCFIRKKYSISGSFIPVEMKNILDSTLEDIRKQNKKKIQNNNKHTPHPEIKSILNGSIQENPCSCKICKLRPCFVSTFCVGKLQGCIKEACHPHLILQLIYFIFICAHSTYSRNCYINSHSTACNRKNAVITVFNSSNS